jgi:hypothetical protein
VGKPRWTDVRAIPPLRHAPETHGSLVEQTADARGIELEPAKLASLARPEKFVVLVTVEEIELSRSFLKSALNG